MNDHNHDQSINITPFPDLSMYKKKDKFKRHKNNKSFNQNNEVLIVNKIKKEEILEEINTKNLDYKQNYNEKILDLRLKYSIPKTSKHFLNSEIKPNYSNLRNLSQINDDIIINENTLENIDNTKQRTITPFKKADGTKILLLRADMILPKKGSNTNHLDISNSFIAREKNRYRYPSDDDFETPSKIALSNWIVPKAKISLNKSMISDFGMMGVESSFNDQSICKAIEFKDNFVPGKIEYSNGRLKKNQGYNDNNNSKEHYNITMSNIKESALQSIKRPTPLKENYTTILSELNKKDRDALKKYDSYNGNEVSSLSKDKSILNRDKTKLPPIKNLNQLRVIITKNDQNDDILKEIFPNVHNKKIKSQSANDVKEKSNIKLEFSSRRKNERSIDRKKTPEVSLEMLLKSKDEIEFERKFEKAQQKLKEIKAEDRNKRRFNNLMVFLSIN